MGSLTSSSFLLCPWVMLKGLPWSQRSLSARQSLRQQGAGAPPPPPYAAAAHTDLFPGPPQRGGPICHPHGHHTHWPHRPAGAHPTAWQLHPTHPLYPQRQSGFSWPWWRRGGLGPGSASTGRARGEGAPCLSDKGLGAGPDPGLSWLCRERTCTGPCLASHQLCWPQFSCL